MLIAVLGPLTVHDDDGAPIAVSGSRLRSLLTRLAVEADRPVSVSALVDAVWGDSPPAEEANALQTLVSRLRRGLGSASIVAAQGGYRLSVRPADIDVHRFESLAARGAAELRGDDPHAAEETLTSALALWRGPALADAATADSALAAHVARLEDLRVAARTDRAEARLALGDPRTVADAEHLVAENPLRERGSALLMRALVADGRQAEALRVYERLRSTLADELGVDPSAELVELHLAVLRGQAEPVAAPRAARRTNLKAQLTSFVGREDEVRRIETSLGQHRLVTLVGPGGAGKTRLSGETAARFVDGPADGVWFVELAPVTAGADVPQAVLDSIGLRDVSALERRTTVASTTNRDPLTRLVDGLVERDALLVIDNCEHVIEATATLADTLLTRCPRLRILATSREPLGIGGEALLPVPPLGQPGADADAAAALTFPAVALFADRAAAVRPNFVVDASTVAAVIEIVRRLDGLPLAIELAAARLRSLPLTDVAARLDDRFRLLTGGSRTALPRHRTLRAVVEWSWDLLAADEQRVVEQLAVFPAGITATSAAAVTGADIHETADVLASLVDKSLLQPIGDGRRLRMLETIREYGAERLVERGELGAVRRRHAEHFAAVMAQAEPHLTRADQVPWFALLREEMENIAAALRLFCDLREVDDAVRLGVSLSVHAMMLGDWENVGAWLGEVVGLPAGNDVGARTLARTLAALSHTAAGASSDEAAVGKQELAEMAYLIADVPDSVSAWVALIRPIVAYFAEVPELIERYFEAGVQHSDDWTRAAVLSFRANFAENNGDTPAARADTEDALAIFTRLGERWGMANALRELAQLQTLGGELEAAVASYAEAMRLSAELQSRDDEGYMYGRLADLELRRGNVDAAREYVRIARRSAEENGTAMESLFTLAMLAAVERASGNLAQARALVAEASARLATLPREHPVQGHIRAILLAASVSLELEATDGADPDSLDSDTQEAYDTAVATNDLPVVAAVGVTLAEVAAARRDAERAAVVLGASARLRGGDDATATEIVRVTALLRAALGEDGFAAAYTRGSALDRDAALAVLDPQARRL